MKIYGGILPNTDAENCGAGIMRRKGKRRDSAEEMEKNGFKKATGRADGRRGFSAAENGYLIAAVVIFCAVTARVLSKENIADNTMGLIRSILYIGLYFVWGISIKRRVMQTQVRRYLLAVVGMMILWFIVRTTKYFFVRDIDIERHLWYVYYFPMLLIPLLSLFVALSLGKTENYRLPASALLLYIPTAVLLLIVLTNDFHEIAFRFPEGQPRSDKTGVYAIGYALVAGWELLCSISALTLLLVKCRTSQRRKYLPVAIMICSVMYAALYASGMQWMQTIGGDLTAAMCLFAAAILESCISCGLIPTNTGYDILFSAGSMRAQITDNEYNVHYSSANAPEIPEQLMRLAEDGDVKAGENFLLRSSNIPGGHVLWLEDISAINELLRELESNRVEIAESNNLERENYNMKLKINALHEKNRLYDLFHEQTAREIALLDDILTRYESAENESERRRLLAQAAIVGAYIKRRGNLMFIGEKSDVTDTTELALCLNELFSNIELLGTECAMSVPERVRIKTRDAIVLYDFFGNIVEAAMDDLRSLWLKVRSTENELVFLFEVETGAADFCECAAACGGAENEDGVWRFALRTERDSADV